MNQLRLIWICNLTMPFMGWILYPSKIFVIMLYIVGIIGMLINYDIKIGEKTE